MRYFFEIAYKGTHYAGWQSQPNAIGVQAVVENVLSKLLKTEIILLGSGRTDTGVHCEKQFFHVDVEEALNEIDLLGKINAFLPNDIAIRSIQLVNNEAHARFSATERTYEYRITLKKNPFLEGQALYYFKTVDIELMNKAAAMLVGVHDFKAFSKVKTDVNNYNCNLTRAEWVKEGERLTFHISANRFLRGMVRAIVGTLLEVGNAKLSLQDFKLIIDSKDRRQAGMNAAPHGLFLTNVVYPASIFQH